MINLAQKEFWSIVIGGSLLSVNAGFINVVTLAGVFSVTVSVSLLGNRVKALISLKHVTGHVAIIGLSLFQKDLNTLVLNTSILMSFMFGSFIAGFLVGDSKFRLGRSYGYCLIVESAALFMSFFFLKQEVSQYCVG